MEIKKGTSFNTVQNNPVLSKAQEALNYYISRVDSASQLLDNIPLFLDTNLLLRGYSLTPDRREMLYDFFKTNQAQIIVSKQVHEEFTRNRTEIRNAFAHNPEAQISDLSDALAGLMLDLQSEDDSENEANAETPDELEDIYKDLKKLDGLSGEEKQFLIKEFNELKSQKTTNFNDVTERESAPSVARDKQRNTPLPFPGMGDIIEKPNFPYGDYFLFHEMLKYAGEQNTDVVFLTFDVAKEDWLQKNKRPHQHYIYKTYTINQKVIFILDANAFLEKKFDTSFEGLIPTEQKKSKKQTTTVVLSPFEEELHLLFTRLEKTIRRIARKFDIDSEPDISTKRILDDMNYDKIISDAVYYELTGIWSVREGLMEGDLETIRRNYTEEELREILLIIKQNSRSIGRL